VDDERLPETVGRLDVGAYLDLVASLVVTREEG
jgi:hypothetical protein